MPGHYTCSTDVNFVDGKDYEQSVLGRGLGFNDANRACFQIAGQKDFFVQQHSNGHTVCGVFKQPVTNADTPRKDGNMTFGNVCRYSQNECHRDQHFVPNKQYSQADLGKNLTYREATNRCKVMANDRDYFVQQHGNGHTVCGVFHKQLTGFEPTTYDPNLRYGAVCHQSRM